MESFDTSVAVLDEDPNHHSTRLAPSLLSSGQRNGYLEYPSHPSLHNDLHGSPCSSLNAETFSAPISGVT